MKLAFCSTEFEKKKKTQISHSTKTRPVGAELCSMRTSRHDETNSRFSQLCEERLTTRLTPNVNGQHLLMLEVENKPSWQELCVCIQFCISIRSHVTGKWFARLVHIWRVQCWNPVANYPDPRSSWFFSITRGKCSDSTSNYGTPPPSTSLPIHYLHSTIPGYKVWHNEIIMAGSASFGYYKECQQVSANWLHCVLSLIKRNTARMKQDWAANKDLGTRGVNTISLHSYFL